MGEAPPEPMARALARVAATLARELGRGAGAAVFIREDGGWSPAASAGAARRALRGLASVQLPDARAVARRLPGYFVAPCRVRRRIVGAVAAKPAGDHARGLASQAAAEVARLLAARPDGGSSRRRAANERLRRHAEELEGLVEERTRALRESNAALAQANLTLETIYASTLDGLLFVDRDLNLVSMNERFGAIFGFAPGEIQRLDKATVRETARSRYEDPRQFDEAFRLYEGGRQETVWDADIILRTPGRRIVHEHSEPIFDDRGGYAGRVWTYRDVTEERLLAREVEHRSRLLATIVDNTADGVFSLDGAGNVLFSNRRLRELLGLGSVPLEGIPLLSAIPERDRPRLEPVVEAALAGEPGIAFEFDLVNRAGKRIHTLWNVHPILGDPSAASAGPAPLRVVRQVVGTVTDFTDRKALEDELIDYTRRLETEVERRSAKLVQAAKMAALGQLVAGVAHEINNPLAYVKSNSETMLEVAEEVLSRPGVRRALAGDAEAHREALSALLVSDDAKFLLERFPGLLAMNLKGLRRISDIVQRLRTFASPQPTRKEPVDLASHLRDTAAIFHAQFRDRVELVEEYADLPPVSCDAGKISQVLMNLLVNAAQAIPGRGRVRIRAGREGGWAAIRVEDDGVGIPANVRTRIFDPFFTTKDRGNTGLGLSISYSIVKEHGGEILVESEAGAGTTVLILLPLDEAPGPGKVA